MTIAQLFKKRNPQDGTIPEWAEKLAIEFAQEKVKEALEIYDKYTAECNPNDNPETIKGLGETLYPLENVK